MNLVVQKYYKLKGKDIKIWKKIVIIKINKSYKNNKIKIKIWISDKFNIIICLRIG